MIGKESYQAAAMELDDYWMFAGFEVFGYEDATFDFVVSDFLVRGAVDVEAIEARSGCGVVERSHVKDD
jgi:hypothetical protein